MIGCLIAKRSIELNGWDGSRRSFSAAVIVAVTLLAAALRIYRLGSWSFWGDEIYTLRDSLTASWLVGPKPLLFFLNHYLVLPFKELDEIGLRILPALFGIAAAPVIYQLARWTLNARSGLFAALLVAVNPWHLYWSQFARYYTLVFLLSAIYPLLLYQGIRQQRIRLVVVGLVFAVLGVLAHPSAALPLGGVALWILITYGPRFRKHSRPGTRALSIIGLVVLAISALALIRLVPILSQWIERGHVGYHRGIPLLLSYVDWVPAVLVVCAAAGVVWLLYAEDRSFGVLLASIVCVPVASLALGTPWIPVYTGYLFSTTPVIFLAAGFFLDRLATVGPDAFRRRLVSTTCLGLLLAASAPQLLSQYRDGGRADFRAAARHVELHGRRGDLVMSSQASVLAHYLPDIPTVDLNYDPAVLAGATRQLLDSSPDATLWVVALILRRGGFNDQGLGSASAWLRTRCQLSASFAVSRLDYKHNELQVYRCPAG